MSKAQETEDEFAGGEDIEVKSGWLKFNKVGDGVKGTLMERRFAKANVPGYQDQWVYDIRNSEGDIVKVGITTNKELTYKKLNAVELGTIVAVWFSELGPKKPGQFQAKYLSVKAYGIDPNYDSYLTGGLEKASPEIPIV